MTIVPISDEAIAQAVAAGVVEANSQIRARSVRYRADCDALEITTTHGAGFLIPRDWVIALHGVAVQHLGELDVWPDGSAIELESCDIHISVDGLIEAVLPRMVPSATIAAMFASRGGRAMSEAKRASARANGRLGGRPSKRIMPEAEFSRDDGLLKS